MAYRKLFSLAIIFSFALILINSVNAVAPTEEAIAKWKAEGTYDKNVADWKAFKSKGGCAPVENRLFDKKKMSERIAAGAQAADTASIIVILVDFSDNPYTGNAVAASPQQFDSILFSDRNIGPVVNPTGSMTDYYFETSYGNFYVIGQVTNWLRMPQTYAFYEGGNHGLGVGGQTLSRDAVLAADAGGINFQDFDRNGDGWVDGLVIIHSGPGAEGTGTGIWSHKYNLSSIMTVDGVNLFDYTMNPEESGNTIAPIGVICHEFGHFLGLPDLYDIDYDPPESDGMGRWSIMASGNYNGNGQRPAHFDAWCKSEIGFLSPTIVTGNMDSVQFPAVEYSPVAYRLANSNSNPEYWIVENRQKIGFDFNLPGEGVIIYHIDGSLGGSNNYNGSNWYRVGLEQADGRNDLQFTLGNTGDNGDPFPGSSDNREFHDYSVPSDEVYWQSIPANIGVWDITDNDSVMYADLDISWSRPYIVVDSIIFDDALGNNNGVLDPGESIRFYVYTRNLMLPGYNARATLSTSDSYVNFTSNNVLFDATFDALQANNVSAPITFDLDINTESSIDSFYLTITCDSTNGGTPGNDDSYTKVYGIEQTVGTPRIMIVDDDRGQEYQEVYTRVLGRNKQATIVWDINSKGIPTIGDIMDFDILIWHTADSAANVITQSRIDVMKQYLDMGNNRGLMLSTMTGVKDMHNVDSAFMDNYFKATFNDTSFSAVELFGVDGAEMGGDVRYNCPRTIPFQQNRQAMKVTSGGEAFLSYRSDGSRGFGGISYRGDYKTILISSPIENVRDSGGTLRDPKDTLFNRAIAFFDDVSTGILDPIGILPTKFQLEQNYPNPFNPSTSISYTIHSRGDNPKKPYRTTLVIYNVLGQHIKTLVDKSQSPGTYTVDWLGDNNAGEPVSSGVYFYRLILGEESQTKKMVLMK